jgi:TM2 domain-containing membrane protein YozV
VQGEVVQNGNPLALLHPMGHTTSRFRRNPGNASSRYSNAIQANIVNTLMPTRHTNKTIATLLALTLGGAGMHRFYVGGLQDRWGWAHFSAVPLSLGLITAGTGWPLIFAASPLILSALIGFIEALVLGLKPDEKWDAQYNRDSGRHSRSGWPLAILLVLTLGIGATALIAVLARTFDMLYTGGAYG